MILSLAKLLWWFQPPAHAGGGGEASGEGSGALGAETCALQVGMFLFILAITYFLLIRPEQKRRQETEQMLRSLRKGMKVRTTGGILGEIVSVNDREVVLAVADKVRINVLRSHIAGLEPEQREASAKDAKNEKDGKDGKGKPEQEESKGARS